MLNQEYEKYIHSSEWRKKANQRLAADDYCCCVCGKPATDVHHVTYENFGNEKMDDLVSLCRECHDEAERLYKESPNSWGNNFMATMRIDAQKVGEEVYRYLTETIGDNFDSLMFLRQPETGFETGTVKNRRQYWGRLKKSVYALCGKRYYRNAVSDRQDIVLDTITNHTAVILLGHIEHMLRNKVQGALHDDVMMLYGLFGRWADVAKALEVSNGTIQTLRRDDGTSAGPSLYEVVLHYCALDAAAGIKPDKGIECLTDEDYAMLNRMAEHIDKATGNEDSHPTYRY